MHDFNLLREYERVIYKAATKGQSAVVTLNRMGGKDFNVPPKLFDTVSEAQAYLHSLPVTVQLRRTLYRGSKE